MLVRALIAIALAWASIACVAGNAARIELWNGTGNSYIVEIDAGPSSDVVLVTPHWYFNVAGGGESVIPQGSRVTVYRMDCSLVGAVTLHYPDRSRVVVLPSGEVATQAEGDALPSPGAERPVGGPSQTRPEACSAEFKRRYPVGSMNPQPSPERIPGVEGTRGG